MKKILTILETSDLHANIYPWDYFTAQPAEHGLAKIATLIQLERAANPTGTILLDNGDTIQGTPLATQYVQAQTTSAPHLDQQDQQDRQNQRDHQDQWVQTPFSSTTDRRATPDSTILQQSHDRDPLPSNRSSTRYPNDPHPMAVVMNWLRYDAMTLGNHDFNYSLDILAAFDRDLSCPLLAANICTLDGRPAFKPYLWKTLEGIQIAILGLTTPRIDVWEQPENVAGLRFDPILTTAQAYLPTLRAQGADLVIISLHSGLDRVPSDRSPAGWLTDHTHWHPTGSLPGENEAIQLAEQVPGIDVILSGHTHQPIPAMWINNVLITQPRFWGSHLAKVTLHLEQHQHRWQIVDKNAILLPVAAVPADPTLLNLTRSHHERTLESLNQPIGRTLTPIPGGYEARFCSSPLAQLINQAQFAAVKAAGIPIDLSLASIYSNLNGIQPGPITLRDAYSIAFFDNTLCVLAITGEILNQALEKTAEYFQQLDPDHLPPDPKEVLAANARHYNWDIYAGIDYTLDLTRPLGQRVTHLRFHDLAIHPDQRFHLVLNNYRARGGGGYDMFKTAESIWQPTTEVRDALVDYIQAHPDLNLQPDPINSMQLIPDLYQIYFGQSALLTSKC